MDQNVTPAPIFNYRKRPRQAVIANPFPGQPTGPSGAADNTYSDLMPVGGFQERNSQRGSYSARANNRGAASTGSRNQFSENNYGNRKSFDSNNHGSGASRPSMNLGPTMRGRGQTLRGRGNNSSSYVNSKAGSFRNSSCEMETDFSGDSYQFPSNAGPSYNNTPIQSHNNNNINRGRDFGNFSTPRGGSQTSRGNLSHNRGIFSARGRGSTPNMGYRGFDYGVQDNNDSYGNQDFDGSFDSGTDSQNFRAYGSNCNVGRGRFSGQVSRQMNDSYSGNFDSHHRQEMGRGQDAGVRGNSGKQWGSGVTSSDGHQQIDHDGFPSKRPYSQTTDHFGQSSAPSRSGYNNREHRQGVNSVEDQWDDSFVDLGTQRMKQIEHKAEAKPKTTAQEPERGLHFLTVDVAGVKRWSKFKDQFQIMFELYGVLDSAVWRSHEGCREFLLKDEKQQNIRCVFYEIDRQFPKVTRGQWYRIVGIYDCSQERLQCLSIRPVKEGERKTAHLTAQQSLQSMSTLTKNMREL